MLNSIFKTAARVIIKPKGLVRFFMYNEMEKIFFIMPKLLAKANGAIKGIACQ